MTGGSNKLDYPGELRPPIVLMLDTKLQINSVISDAKKGAQHL